MGYSNSPLVSYTNLTKHHSGQRTHQIDTITIHCFVGQVTAKRGCDYFATTPKEASCNYVVGFDGSIGLSVEEKNRSWCTSSNSNDQRAITIEVASDNSEPYAVTDAAYEGLIKLVVDICQRNGIKKLVWSTSKNDRINHLNGCNMTVHRDYANKSCPGAYLYSRHGDIADRVNSMLNGESVVLEMTKEELKKFIEETVKQMGVGEPADAWASEQVEVAKGLGITDGSNPKRLATREEVMIMAARAASKK